MRLMNVLWLANIPSPYRVKFFNELGKKCDLTVLFEKKASSERDESWKKIEDKNFHAVYLKGKSVGVAEAFCPSVIKYLKKRYDHIVVTNYSDPTGILAVLWMRLFHIKYEIEGDGAFPGIKSGLKARVKQFIFKGATVCFSSAKMHDKYYRSYGVSQKKIIRYTFTSIMEKDILENVVTQEEKLEVRKKLNIPEPKVILAIGQFIYRKGFDTLLYAMKEFPDTVGVYIVGGKATSEYMDIVSQNNIKNIHFIDFIQPDELKKYFYAADLFVHPTREDIWGLVINEAMANGLPVITTDRCIAGLEMVYDGVNGRIVKAGNVDELRDAILAWLDKENVSNGVSLKIAKKYTIENMAKNHVNLWKNI